MAYIFIAAQIFRLPTPSLVVPLVPTQIKPTKVHYPYPSCVPAWTCSSENLGYAMILSLVTVMCAVKSKIASDRSRMQQFKAAPSSLWFGCVVLSIIAKGELLPLTHRYALSFTPALGMLHQQDQQQSPALELSEKRTQAAGKWPGTERCCSQTPVWHKSV